MAKNKSKFYIKDKIYGRTNNLAQDKKIINIEV